MRSTKIRFALLLSAAATACGVESTDSVATDTDIKQLPNIVLIVADDLGYTDIGAMGGEIPTPNIDQLAGAGMLLTNFHVAPGCSPTRSMLLSGTDNHLAGVGSLHELLAENQRNRPGYQGYLSEEIISLPKLLRHAGYRTYMAGKWHLGQTQELGPGERGFDRSFAMLDGGASHFGDQRGIYPSSPQARYRDDGDLITIPENFYSSYFFTDKIIEYLKHDQDSEQPFFAYLAYTAPHWPLQAPDEWIDRFRGHYDEGYTVIRARRIEKMRQLGLIDENVTAAPISALTRPWNQLNAQQQTDMARRMEIYAAMVAAMDDQIGKLIAHLKNSGRYENTVILFFSDNGPDFTLQDQRSRIADWIQQEFDNSPANKGKIGSFISYGPGWSQASAGISRLFKGTTAQGGILSPLIAVSPKHIMPGSRSHSFSTVMDIMPTLLSLANIEAPTSFKGKSVQQMRGRSLLPMLTATTQEVHPPDYVFGMELLDSRALRQGDWKAVNVFKPLGPARWQLYNLASDPGETRDLTATEPARLQQMIDLYQSWASEVGVIEPLGGPPLTNAMLSQGEDK